MLKLEKYFLKFVEKHLSYFYIAIISLLAFIVRWLGRSHISNDMKEFLIPWYNEAKVMGITSIGTGIGDYNIPYQFYVALITYLPINPIISYKLLSISFDYILALSGAILSVLITKNEDKKNVFLMVYTIILFLPTIFLNSGYWGQADSIYTEPVKKSL